MLGYDNPAEILALPNVRSLLAENEHERLNEYLKTRQQGGTAPEEYEVEGVRRDGTTIWLQLSIQPVTWEGRNFIANTVVDISERKRATEALRESEKRFQSFANLSADFYYETDANFRVTQISDPYKLAGADLTYYMGKTRWEVHNNVIDGRDEDEEMQAMRKLESYRNIERYSYISPERWLRVSGEPIFSESGDFLGYRCAATEITDLRKKQADLAQSEENFRRLVEGSHHGFYIHDQQRPIFANQALADLLGYESQEEILALPSILSLFAQEERADIDQRFVRRGRGEPSPTRYEAIGLHKDGTKVSLDISIQYVVWKGKRLIIAYDISEQKRLEEHLRQTQKMEAIGQLTAGIAHDFNNLLAIMMGNVALLEYQLGSHHASSRLLQPTMRALKQAVTLTSHMLAFSRQQPLRVQKTDVNALLRDSQPLIESSLAQEIDVTYNLASELWHCDIDPTQLEQVLLNLSINARDAMVTRGSLTIETANISANESDEYSADMRAGSYIMIAVTDNGEGISEEDLPQIFDPFFTTKGIGAGTGLGLSMVYGFVKQSNGHITVASTKGDGATFRIYLKASEDTEIQLPMA